MKRSVPFGQDESIEPRAVVGTKSTADGYSTAATAAEIWWQASTAGFTAENAAASDESRVRTHEAEATSSSSKARRGHATSRPDAVVRPESEGHDSDGTTDWWYQGHRSQGTADEAVDGKIGSASDAESDET